MKAFSGEVIFSQDDNRFQKIIIEGLELSDRYSHHSFYIDTEPTWHEEKLMYIQCILYGLLFPYSDDVILFGNII